MGVQVLGESGTHLGELDGGRLDPRRAERPHRLVFLFAADPSEEGQWTRVTIEIAATATGCTLTLTHEMDPEWAAYEQQTRHGWTMILASLARVM